MGRQQASKIYKTKRTKRDPDQILNEDLKSKAAIDALKSQRFDEYLPGLGQHYCVPCAKYFETQVALESHQKSKVHKRQLKNIKLGPYTQEEAAAGSGRDVEKFLKKQKDQTNLLNSEAKEQLTTVKGQSHVKKTKGSGDMAVDTLDEPQVEPEAGTSTSTTEGPGSAAEEITV